MGTFRKGSDVEWTWGAHKANGKVVDRFTKDVSRRIKGKTVKRKASTDEPAFLVRQEDGDKVLKSASELKAANKKPASH